jgi:hypothetical protein
MGEMLGVASGEKLSASRLIANLGVGQFVPASAFNSWLNRMIDDVKRRPDEYSKGLNRQLQYAMLRFPMLSKKVPPIKTPKGEPIKDQYKYINALLPLRMSKENQEYSERYKKVAELNRYNRLKKDIIELIRAGKKDRVEKADSIVKRYKNINSEAFNTIMKAYKPILDNEQIMNNKYAADEIIKSLSEKLSLPAARLKTEVDVKYKQDEIREAIKALKELYGNKK